MGRIQVMGLMSLGRVMSISRVMVGLMSLRLWPCLIAALSKSQCQLSNAKDEHGNANPKEEIKGIGHVKAIHVIGEASDSSSDKDIGDGMNACHFSDGQALMMAFKPSMYG